MTNLSGRASASGRSTARRLRASATPAPRSSQKRSAQGCVAAQRRQAPPRYARQRHSQLASRPPPHAHPIHPFPFRWWGARAGRERRGGLAARNLARRRPLSRPRPPGRFCSSLQGSYRQGFPAAVRVGLGGDVRICAGCSLSSNGPSSQSWRYWRLLTCGEGVGASGPQERGKGRLRRKCQDCARRLHSLAACLFLLYCGETIYRGY